MTAMHPADRDKGSYGSRKWLGKTRGIGFFWNERREEYVTVWSGYEEEWLEGADAHGKIDPSAVLWLLRKPVLQNS